MPQTPLRTRALLLRSSLAIALVGMVGTKTATHPSHAAVRVCLDEIQSDVVEAQTELEAKRKALDLWRAKASASGEQFSAWRIAADKMLTCLPAKSGAVECYARARPCTIDQAPDKRELRAKRLDM